MQRSKLIHKVCDLIHLIAPEAEINFYVPQAKRNTGLDSDIDLLIPVNKEKLSYDVEMLDAFSAIGSFKGMK